MWPRMHFLDLQGLYVFWTAGVTTVTLLPFALRIQYESTIQNMLPELEKKELICNLFHRLNPLFTFMDYKLLKHLVSKFGSPKLKKDMVSYAEKMQLFKKTTTVSQLIDC